MAVALALLAAPACTDDCSEGPGIDDALASAERWVRARSWPGIGSTEGTTSVDLRVAPVASDGTEGPTALETLAIHDSFAPGIESAFAHGERVYLAVASEGLEDETVSYVVSVNTDGDHHLVGESCFERGEAFLRDRLGDRFDEVMAQVIGMTDQDRILILLGADEP